MHGQKIYFRYISMSSYKKHSGKKNSERFEPRNHVINKWKMTLLSESSPVVDSRELENHDKVHDDDVC